MPEPVAPRLLAADIRAGILLMEDLGPGGSLAGSLLDGDRQRAQADLISYAEALGSMHAWSMGRPGELAELRIATARKHRRGRPGCATSRTAGRRSSAPWPPWGWRPVESQRRSASFRRC
jgi:hypothetical protein